MFKIVSVIIVAICLASCTSTYTKTVNAYMAVAPSIKLGDTKESVIEKLAPTQVKLSNLDIKAPETFYQDGKLVEILFFRSGWQDDGITTDDEFTPYVFEDGILTSIGWTIIGGAKTQAKPRSDKNNDRIYYHPYPYRYRPYPRPR